MYLCCMHEDREAYELVYARLSRVKAASADAGVPADVYEQMSDKELTGAGLQQMRAAVASRIVHLLQTVNDNSDMQSDAILESQRRLASMAIRVMHVRQPI